MRKVDIYVEGLQGAGGFFVKELARLLFGAKGQGQELQNVEVSLLLFDGGKVTKRDVSDGTFLLDDIGWNRAAVLGGCLRQAYGTTRIRAYAKECNKDSVSAFWLEAHGYSAENVLSLFFNFSGRKTSVKQAVDFLQLKKVDVFHIMPGKEKFFISYQMGHFSRKESGDVFCPSDMADALYLSGRCLALTVSLLSGKIPEGDAVIRPLRIGQQGDRLARMPFGEKKTRWLVVCVGTGGTGGNFCKEFPHMMVKNKNLSLLMIDGDRVEEKNLKRQPFLTADIQQNKADILCEDLLLDYPVLAGRIFSYGAYLDTPEDLMHAISAVPAEYDEVLLIGCVDNHAARRVMQAYHEEKEQSVYIDAANEWSNGEVVIAARKGGMDFSPIRSFYFPDVLTDRSPSASEVSCGAVNESSPQHLVTNLTSAQNLYSAVSPLLVEHTVGAGIIYFDAFKGFSRYQPVSILMQKEAAYV